MPGPSGNTKPGALVGLDLGTHTGVAIWIPGLNLQFRTLHLAEAATLQRARRSDPRALRKFEPRALCLFSFLHALKLRIPAPVWVAFEDVQFIKSTAQGQLWPTWRAAMWLSGITTPERFLCVPTGTLKSFATGNGGADKDAMLRCFNTRFHQPSGTNFDENLVDAGWVLAWAAQTHFGVTL